MSPLQIFLKPCLSFFDSRQRSFHLKLIIILFLLAILVYANSFGNAMFWDDDDFILRNRYIKDFSYWPMWFKENLVAGSYLVSNYWRPLLLAVFSIEWSLFKDNVYGWHVVSTLWHAGVASLIYIFFIQLRQKPLLSFIIAALYLLHPAHNEAVVYVNSLGDSLAISMVLLSLICYIRFRQSQTPALLSRPFWFSLFFYPLALMSKETGFVLVGLIVLLDMILLLPYSNFWFRIKDCLRVVWPFFLIAIFYVILRGTALNFSNSFNFYNESNAFSTHIHLRFLTFCKAMIQYLGFMFIPYELRVERHLPFANSLFEWDVLVGLTVILAAVFAIFYFYKRMPIISFGLALFFVAIFPASNILIPINAVIYEHFLYLPLLGPLSAVTFACYQWQHIQPRLRFIFSLLLGFYTLFFILMNVMRNPEWKTAIGFYEKIATYAPSFRVIHNLGMEYANKKIYDKAETYYLKAISMDPRQCVVYHNLAGLYRDTGRIPQAIDTFKKAIALNPQFIFSYRSLAQLYWQIQELDSAAYYMKIIYDYDPHDQQIQVAYAALQEEIKKKAALLKKQP